MRRRALISHLEAHGCRLVREGRRHSWYGNPANNKRSAVPRHTETPVREANGVDLRFEIGTDAATFYVSVGENGVTAKAKLSRDKDTVTAVLTEVEEKGKFPNKPNKGDKLAFK